MLAFFESRQNDEFPVRADSTSSEPRRQKCDRGRCMAHHYHPMSVPNKASHLKSANKSKGFIHPICPAAIFSSKIFIQRAKIHARQHQPRLQQPRTALPRRETNDSSISCTNIPTTIRQSSKKKRSARPRYQFQDRKLLRICLLCKHSNSNNNPTQNSNNGYSCNLLINTQETQANLPVMLAQCYASNQPNKEKNLSAIELIALQAQIPSQQKELACVNKQYYSKITY
jgi:hypothetical protein